jgi:ubiquinol-cytochrome c reductase subunit 6
MDDEDPVDNRPDLEEACKPKCAKFIAAYEGCVGRVEKDTTGEAHCTGQYFDMWGCIDKCVAPTLFKHTK